MKIEYVTYGLYERHGSAGVRSRNRFPGKINTRSRYLPFWLWRPKWRIPVDLEEASFVFLSSSIWCVRETSRASIVRLISLRGPSKRTDGSRSGCVAKTCGREPKERNDNERWNATRSPYSKIEIIDARRSIALWEVSQVSPHRQINRLRINLH